MFSSEDMILVLYLAASVLNLSFCKHVNVKLGYDCGSIAGVFLRKTCILHVFSVYNSFVYLSARVL